MLGWPTAFIVGADGPDRSLFTALNNLIAGLVGGGQAADAAADDDGVGAARELTEAPVVGIGEAAFQAAEA